MKLVTVVLATLACAAPGSGQSDATPPATPAPPTTQVAAQVAPPAAVQVAPQAATPPAEAGARSGGWRLAEATSPYLRAHADNPVEWYPWGEEAFARAAALQRPIFLSIGYSACHWCHRMEHDTFEDAECAQLLNEHFVCIKVDREERPDIDNRYMQALQLITGAGGWPASLFLTSDGMAFAGGTYFAPEDTQETPGFKRLLTTISGLWETQRETILNAGKELTAALLQDPLAAVAAADALAATGAPLDLGTTAPPAGPDLPALLDKGLLELTGSLDGEHGGTFGTPKFPPPMLLSFLLGQHAASGVDVLGLVRRSLDAMAGGALQDHVGGGFHRYCLDEEWKVPHFEKMLSDNALLAVAYAEGFAATGEREYADVARRTLAFVARDLRVPAPDALYATSLDADSLPFDEHGVPAPGARVEEGRFYLWSFAELKSVLGDTDGPRFAALYGAGNEGNLQGGRSILRPMRTRAALLADIGAGRVADWPADAPHGEELLPWVDGCLARLAEARARRPQPLRDDKCVAAQNGLLLTAFARTGGLAQDLQLRQLAAELALHVRRGLLPDGPASLKHQLYRSVASGEPDLLDHAALARGLIDEAALTGNVDDLALAVQLARQMLDRFEDPDDGAFFDTMGNDPHLPGRSRDVWDEALPSGTSVALDVLLRLAPLDDSGQLATAARRAIGRLAPLAQRSSQSFSALFEALELARGPLVEIVLDGSGPAYEALATEVARTPLPAALVVPHARLLAAALADSLPATPALLQDRVAPEGEARAWVCVNRTCLLPASTVDELRAQLAAAAKR